MRRIRVRWYWPLALGFMGLMTFNVQKMVRAEPPTMPRAKDAAKAERIAPPPRGQVDERDRPAPEGAISGAGVVEPLHPETKVGGAQPGRIATIAVVEGQRVAANDPLVELDHAVETAQLAATEADLDAAKAQLTRAVRGSRREDVAAAIADADTAKQRSELSRGVAERLEKAAAGGGATVDELERAKTTAQADVATARAADARRAAVIAGSRSEDIALARAQVAAAEARRDQAKAAVDRLTVRAPIAGEILQVHYRAGEYYQPGGEALVVLGDTSRLTVRMDVDERDIGAVAEGAPVMVRANAFPDKDFVGKVSEIGRRMGRKNVRSDDPAERNDTKILEVVLLLDDPNGLVVGERVTCYVTPSAPKTAAAP